MRGLKSIILLLIVATMMVGCGAATLVNVGKNLDLVKIEKIEIKGLTGLQISAEVNNSSRHDIAMEEGVVEVMLDGESIATLTQVGRVEVAGDMHGTISSLWKISDVDPLTILKLTAKVATKDYEGLSANYEAKLSAGKTKRTISGKEVDIQKLLVIFAS